MLKSYDSGRREQKRGHGVRDMYILHDNAKPHVHINVRNFLESKGLKEIDHPTYSPDLEPCEFGNSIISRNVWTTRKAKKL